jgi:dipeptidyl aminopeptidase/acylaminoacyl peptidase
MGTVEVQDQMEGLKYLIAKGLVDPSRIAVQGWSYGGYLSLMCLAQQPHFFKVMKYISFFLWFLEKSLPWNSNQNECLNCKLNCNCCNDRWQ